MNGFGCGFQSVSLWIGGILGQKDREMAWLASTHHHALQEFHKDGNFLFLTLGTYPTGSFVHTSGKNLEQLNDSCHEWASPALHKWNTNTWHLRRIRLLKYNQLFYGTLLYPSKTTYCLKGLLGIWLSSPFHMSAKAGVRSPWTVAQYWSIMPYPGCTRTAGQRQEHCCAQAGSILGMRGPVAGLRMPSSPWFHNPLVHRKFFSHNLGPWSSTFWTNLGPWSSTLS